MTCLRFTGVEEQRWRLLCLLLYKQASCHIYTVNPSFTAGLKLVLFLCSTLYSMNHCYRTKLLTWPEKRDKYVVCSERSVLLPYSKKVTTLEYGVYMFSLHVDVSVHTCRISLHRSRWIKHSENSLSLNDITWSCGWTQKDTTHCPPSQYGLRPKRKVQQLYYVNTRGRSVLSSVPTQGRQTLRLFLLLVEVTHVTTNHWLQPTETSSSLLYH